MQQDASNAKQLVIERVRQSTNILVAVSANPSVDALAASLGLALMLNKMDKHATAVFSGSMPPAMDFLQPGKTFENSVDSLRDFIISLDKEKADRLRYKVEDDVVRIFITPYRTIINEKDLQFSQGDFNVDLILALGVEKREELDKAIIAHGRILHDAAVMTINANNQQSTLGVVDWHEPTASSLCEMLVSMAEAFQQPGLLDQQIATSLLTGIVAATDRFSNEHTTPRVMTMSAQLMAAGANQQLIANNLVKAHELPQQPASGQLTPDAPSVKVAAEAEEESKKDGELDISHPKVEAPKIVEPAQTPTQPSDQQKTNNNQPQQQKNDNKQRGKRGRGPRSAEEELAAALPSAAAATSAFDELKEAIEKEPKAPGSQSVNSGDGASEDTPKEPEGYVTGSGSWRGRRLEPPTLGGTLNATTEKAMDDSRKAEEEERNQKLLTHSDENEGQKSKAKTIEPPTLEHQKAVISEPPVAPIAPPVVEAVPIPEPAPPKPATPVEQPKVAPEPEPAPIPPAPAPASEAVSEAAPNAPESTKPDVAPPDLDAARQAVNNALLAQPFDPAGQPLQGVGANIFEPESTNGQSTPPPPAFSAPLPEPPPVSTAPALSEPALPPLAPVQPDGMSALPPLPPMPPLPQQDPNQPFAPPPSLNDLLPLPANIPTTPVVVPPPVVVPQQQEQSPADPKQFQIPQS